MSMETNVSPVARNLADKIAPAIVKMTDARRDEIIAAVGNFLIRAAFRMAFPAILGWIPWLVAMVADALLDEYGKKTINELTQDLMSHKIAKK